jgi:hypothetical protein
MLAPEGISVQCSVTHGTLADLAHVARVPVAHMFERYRDAIENAASQVYDTDRREFGFVVVHPCDVKRVLLTKN